MSLKLTFGAAAAGLLAVTLTGQTAFAAGAGQATGPGTAKAAAVRCVARAKAPGPVGIFARCCPPVSRLAFRPPPGAAGPPEGARRGTVVSIALCCPALVRPPRGPEPARPVQVVLHGKPGRVTVLVAACAAQVLTFDAPAGATVFTEVRGPRLAVHEPVVYRGRLYLIASVSGRHFALDYQGRLFRNNGPAIHDGRAFLPAAAVVQLVAPHCHPVRKS